MDGEHASLPELFHELGSKYADFWWNRPDYSQQENDRSCSCSVSMGSLKLSPAPLLQQIAHLIHQRTFLDPWTTFQVGRMGECCANRVSLWAVPHNRFLKQLWLQIFPFSATTCSDLPLLPFPQREHSCLWCLAGS